MDLQASPIDRKQTGKTRVRVAIRVRPMMPREMVGDYRPCIDIKSQAEIIIGTDRQLTSDKSNCREYKYDRVFRDDSPQQDVYVHCIRELVLSCFQGYNAAVLAYGQTGSGKTYTMGTALSTLAESERLGIIPRVINQIFQQVEERKVNALITVTASYIELYNEQIIDLLVDSQFKIKNDSIAIKEDKETGLVNVQGVIKQCVTTTEQMMRLLQRGGTHRTTKHTNMNDTSSRSHAIFTIYIDSEPIRSQKEDKKEESMSGITHSRFFFADLAGSERAKKTGATGDTLKEGININLGLLQLGNVISALSTIEKNKEQFITFRNSKLTRILQDALGGNSNTYMIACVSPAESNYQESLNTLKYASKAMNIKNTPVINRNKNDMLKQQNLQLKAENRRLKQMLAEKGVRIQLEDEKPDMIVMESKLLKDENRTLNRRYNQCLVELQKTKHKLNQFQIKMYDIRREKDIMQLNFQELLKDNPHLAEGEIAASLKERFQENQRDKVTVVEKYLQQLQILETKIIDKDNLFAQLQTEYNSLLQNSKKDQKILIKKHNLLYAIGRQNNKLKQQIARLNQQGGGGQAANQTVLQNTTIGQQMAEQIQEMMMIDQSQTLGEDQLIQQEQQDYCKREQQTKQQLNEVDRYILQKQQFLQKISREQINLQGELISSMKNQYHQKIELLQKEKKQLLKQRDESGTVEKNKFFNKIQNLQGELKDYRKKAKQQRNLQKLVQNQTSRIKDLAEQIKKFKMQKMQLHRKLKQDKDCFQKLKTKRVKQLLLAKKENLKKQNDIRKQRLKNFKYEQNVKKKQQQIKRVKRMNQALKNIIKPSRNSHLSKKQSAPQSNFLVQQATSNDIKQFEKLQQQFVTRITKIYLSEIQRQHSITDLQSKLQKAQNQLMLLLNDDATNKIKLQRIQLKEPQQLTQQDLAEKGALQITVRNYAEQINSYQAYISELQQSPEHTTTVEYFDIETGVIYNKNYQNIEAMRSFVKAFNQAFKNLIFQNCRMLNQRRRDEAEIQGLKGEIFQQRQKIMNLNAQMHRILSQARQEMMNRFYSAEQPQTVSVGLKRLDDRDKKQMERKVQDLAKNNRHLATQLEKTRRKCEIVQQKYQSIKNLVSKDKNIGRQQQPNFTKPQKKLQKNASTRQLIEQVDFMMEANDRLRKARSFNSLQQSNSQQNIPAGFGQGEPSANRWQCIWKQDAHTSGVLSIAVQSNFLISTATKSIKIWDLQYRKVIAELPAAASVKYVMIDPERKLFYTACEKMVTIWDLISLETKGILKCHRDEVRVIHNHGDYLFTGGKGTPNGGSLLIWDLRKLNPNQALEEKQKNQDIFAFTSKQNILFYGTRNHSVRRMTIGTWDVLSPFQPPHLDSVSGLTVVGNKLISGSKDKHLKLWSLDHAVNNNQHTFHVFNDYVTTIQSPPGSPMFYTGSKDGQVKSCYIKNDRIEVMGGILAHTQAINSICTLQENPYGLITASQDKMIKIWHPTKETIENMARQNYF